MQTFKALKKVHKVSPLSAMLKIESGEFPSFFISLLSLTVVAVAASNYSMSVFKFFMSSAVQNLSLYIFGNNTLP